MGVALLSLLGLFLSLYLYLYKLGVIGTLACGTGGCETVQFSKYARFLGVEVSLIGAVGYAGLLVLALASTAPKLAAERWPVQLLAALSGIGVLFAIYLTALELFVIHAICRWCVGSAVIICAIFLLAVLESRPTPARRIA